MGSLQISLCFYGGTFGALPLAWYTLVHTLIPSSSPHLHMRGWIGDRYIQPTPVSADPICPRPRSPASLAPARPAAFSNSNVLVINSSSSSSRVIINILVIILSNSNIVVITVIYYSYLLFVFIIRVLIIRILRIIDKCYYSLLLLLYH